MAHFKERLFAFVLTALTSCFMVTLHGTTEGSQAFLAPCCVECEQAVLEAHEACDRELEDPGALYLCHQAAEDADVEIFGCDGWCISECSFGCEDNDIVWCDLLTDFSWPPEEYGIFCYNTCN